jgi:hypothetical protein
VDTWDRLKKVPTRFGFGFPIQYYSKKMFILLLLKDVHTLAGHGHGAVCDRLLKQILIDLCRFSTKFMQATERYSHSAHTTEQEILHKTAN